MVPSLNPALYALLVLFWLVFFSQYLGWIQRFWWMWRRATEDQDEDSKFLLMGVAILFYIIPGFVFLMDMVSNH